MALSVRATVSLPPPLPPPKKCIVSNPGAELLRCGALEKRAHYSRAASGVHATLHTVLSPTRVRNFQSFPGAAMRCGEKLPNP